MEGVCVHLLGVAIEHRCLHLEGILLQKEAKPFVRSSLG